MDWANPNVSRLLRAWMSKHRLSYAAVGERLGVSGKTVSRWVLGSGVPRDDVLVDLVGLVATLDGLDLANALADLVGTARITEVPASRPPASGAPSPVPPPAPTPPADAPSPATVVAPPTPDASRAPTADNLATALLLLAEHHEIAPRELRSVVHRLVLEWSEQGWSIDGVREALEGLERRAVAMASRGVPPVDGTSPAASNRMDAVRVSTDGGDDDHDGVRDR